jgi:hypothetical protein
MQYAVKQGQDIYAVAVQLYGDPQYAIKLCNDNGLTITDSIEGLTLIYDDNIKRNVVKNAIKQPEVPNVINNSYFVKTYQNIYDLALQFGYGLDRLVEFAQMVGVQLSQIDISNQTIQVTKIRTNLPLGLNFATYSDVFTPAPSVGAFILMESSGYVLLESGDKIELE